MDIQFNGANSVTISNKQARLVIDDNLKELGLNSVAKPDDIVMVTDKNNKHRPKASRLIVDSPGEYEVGNFSIYGIAARSHTDEPEKQLATIYKVITNDMCIVILGHIYPELSDSQLEAIGRVDILLVPVGGHGYTLDAVGALKLIRQIEPKIVIPTHYADAQIKYPVPQDTLEDALKTLAMEPKDRVPKLKIKSSDLADITQLIVVERS